MSLLSIYVHIPFCRHRCAYCDFNTYTSLNHLKKAYTEALCSEIEQVAKKGDLGAHTVFFGGGTPSLMPASAINKILQTIKNNFNLTVDAEITMEANPGTVDNAYLLAVRDAGINRLSFGVQSANANELTLLEREHDFPTVIEAVSQSKAAGFDNINLDLIYGLPEQTMESWIHSLLAALTLEVEHLSLYCLTIEPGTPMARWLRNGKIPPPNPDLAADQYSEARILLKQSGFVHYEISNWAKEGRECRHNLTYWRNQSYLGFGAGAHGHADNTRYHIVKQPRVYIRRLQESSEQPYPLSAAVAQATKLDQPTIMSDTVITQLRLLQEGLPLHEFTKKFGRTIDEVYTNTPQKMQAWGLLKRENDRLTLTEQGALVSNQVFYRFL